MDTPTINSFFDELEKISKKQKKKGPLTRGIKMIWSDKPLRYQTLVGGLGAGLGAGLSGGKLLPIAAGTLAGGLAGHRLGTVLKRRERSTRAKEKTAEDQLAAQPTADNLITKDRFKRFLGAAGAGALGTGIGYGAGHLVGAPIENKLVEWGVRRGPAKVLRYALPTAAGLGAALSLARTNLRNELFKKVKGEDAERNTSSQQQPSQLG